MSYITDVLIYGAEKTAIENVNAWLQDYDAERQQQFEPLDTDAAGGSKVFCGSVYAAAFNYMPLHLIDLLKNPETWLNGCLRVMVIVHGENSAETFAFGYPRDTRGVVCRGVSIDGYEFSK